MPTRERPIYTPPPPRPWAELREILLQRAEAIDTGRRDAARPQFGLYVSRRHRVVWLRLFGWGLHAKDQRRNWESFSERNGRQHRLVLGPLAVKVLHR